MKNLLILLLVFATSTTALLSQGRTNLPVNAPVATEENSCDGKLKISAFGSNCLHQLGINAQDVVDAGTFDLSLMAGFGTNRYYGNNVTRLALGYQLDNALGIYLGGRSRSLPTHPAYNPNVNTSDAIPTSLYNGIGTNFVWSTTITGEIAPFATFFQGPIWQQIVVDYNITTDFADRPEISGIGSISFQLPATAFKRDFIVWFGAWSLLFDNFPSFVTNQRSKFRFNSDFGLTTGISFCL
ncbi:MAG: hypothetical protein R2828_07555 [Saprospiraceae bacterium]